MKDSRARSKELGFTLIEILVAMTILAIVMSILYSSFSTSSAHARIIGERMDDISSLTGAVDTVSQEVKSVYMLTEGVQPVFTWKKDLILFDTLTPFVKEDEPKIQRISYSFSDEKLTRKVFQGNETTAKSESVLLDGIKEPSFAFFNGIDWVEEWPSSGRIPTGVRVSFSYKGRDVKTVIPILSKR